ncbi:MAG TPA: hypothetical protein VN936_04755 [Candidatus Acidoferrum sp.]|nr:hypothetical protein [Candidatus Acidoferrum sp.]
MWSALGLAAALVLSAAAWRRSATPAGYYDGQVYGMTPATHRRYALVAIGFAIAFGLAAASRFETGAIVVLALFVPIAIFYVSSFVRGAEDE